MGKRGRKPQPKRCPRCGTTDVAKFGKNKRQAHGLQVYCRVCISNYSNTRWYYIQRAYGITKEQYEALLAEQGGVCALCKKPPTDEFLVVDHDHTTGQVRGLLHRLCNSMLGCAMDDPELLEAGIKYLRKTTNFQLPTPCIDEPTAHLSLGDNNGQDCTC